MRRGPRSLALKNEQDSDENGQIKCICGIEDDDGFTIQCDVCLIWQHASCVGIGKTNIPERYYCDVCAPASFPLHKQRSTNAENFKQTDVLDVSDKEVAAFLSVLTRSLQQSNMDSVSIYCPLSLESLKITSKPAEDKNYGSSKFSTKFYLKPIKPRGYQKRGITPKYGLFSKTYFEPGTFLCNFTGKACMKSAFKNMVPTSCLQSFVLFIQNTPLAIDARKQGNTARFIRHSCRPNVQIEIATDLADFSKFQINLLALNNIYEGDEILLPNDFDFGNNVFKYDCACANPEFCLSSCLFGSFLFNSDEKKSSQSNSGISQESDSDNAYPKVTQLENDSSNTPQEFSDSDETANQFDRKDERIYENLHVHISTTHEIVHTSAMPNNYSLTSLHSIEEECEEDAVEEFVDVELISDESLPLNRNVDLAKSDNFENSTPIQSDFPAEFTSESNDLNSTPNKIKVSLSDYIKLRKTAQPTERHVESVLEKSTEIVASQQDADSPKFDEDSGETEVERYKMEDSISSQMSHAVLNSDERLQTYHRNELHMRTTTPHSDLQYESNNKTHFSRSNDYSYSKATVYEKSSVPDPYRYSNGNERMKRSHNFDSHPNDHSAFTRRSVSPSNSHRYSRRSPSPTAFRHFPSDSNGGSSGSYHSDYHGYNSASDRRYHPNDYQDSRYDEQVNHDHSYNSSYRRHSYGIIPNASRHYEQNYTNSYHTNTLPHGNGSTYPSHDFRRRSEHSFNRQMHSFQHHNHSYHNHTNLNGNSRYYNGQQYQSSRDHHH